MKGKADDADLLALKEFIDCIRQHRRPAANEEMGWNQAVTVALCNKALAEARKIWESHNS